MFVYQALADSDYNTTSVIRTFDNTTAVGTMMCLTVAILDDAITEGGETFTVTLALNSTGVELEQTVVTIEDNEGERDYIW